MLIPMENNKMQNSWEGPVEVLEEVNDCTYVKRPPTKVVGTHMNRLKAYHSREPMVNMICSVEGETEASYLIDLTAECQSHWLLLNIEVCRRLKLAEKSEVMSALQAYKQVFSSKDS